MSQWSSNSAQAFIPNDKADHELTNINDKVAAICDEDLQEFVSFTKQQLRSKKSNKCLFVTVAVFLFVVFAGAVVILVLLFLLVGERSPRIKLGCGDVEGDFDSATKAFIFRGIRYAAAPIGPLRFKPSVELSKNQSCKSGEIYRAVNDPPQCVQKDILTGHVSGSEDCLYLNIFSPAVEPLHLAPVMVYIHGGYLQFGNATTPGYCPDGKTATSLGIVFVNIQYRLNAFGFLVTEVDSGTGNYGFHDQIVALKWIQQNIEKFGGDPKKDMINTRNHMTLTGIPSLQKEKNMNKMQMSLMRPGKNLKLITMSRPAYPYDFSVTIFGHSSGGTSVLTLMTSPKAKGLFHRAWMLSGSPILNKTLEDARAQNKFLLEKVNCPTLHCLQNLKAEDLVNALYPEWDVLKNSVDLPTKGVFEPALPVIDGIILKVPPFDAWDNRENKFYSDVPLVVGTTAQEVDFGPAPGLDIKTWDKIDLFNYVTRYLNKFDPTYSNITLSYLYASDKDPEYVLTTVISDVRVNCGNNLLAAKAAAALQSSVFRYVVTLEPSHVAHPLNFQFPAKYAFHSLDIYGFLDTFNLIMQGASSSDQGFIQIMSDNMLTFAKEGYPFDTKWKPYPGNVALLDNYLINNKTDYNEPQCKFWTENNFFSYSWIN